jgi:glycosyltransferase involved in cell wall biosynthesis
MNKKKKLLFVGPLPEPKGGVSVHIERLSNLIRNDFKISYIDESKNIKEENFNIRSFNVYQYFKIINDCDIVHIHSGVPFLVFFHSVFSKLLFKKVIITWHNTPFFRNSFTKYLSKIALKIADKVIFVNEESPNILPYSKQYFVKEAFLPPNMEEETALPKLVDDWIEQRRKRNSIILSANAWKLSIFQGVDLYGLDMCIELMNKIRNDNVSFVFVVGNREECKELFEKYQSKIEQMDLIETFLLTSTPLPFVKIIEKSDIVLRPTNTDGDALTIREALYMNVPVISSDVVKRPKGTIIFASRNQTDLIDKTKSTLDNINSIKNSLEYENEDYYNFYMKLYKELSYK